MHHYSQGKSLKQAHKAIPEGHFEEEQGLKGFYGPVSHLVRKKPSTNWIEIDGPLKPRMFDLVELKKQTSWLRLLYNQQVGIYYHWLQPDQPKDQAFRNADGDTIYFVHKGSGEVFSDYGRLTYKPGHYVCVPKCLTHSFVASEASEFFIIENRNSHYEEPDRGMVGRQAVYDINTLGKPDLAEQENSLKELGLEISKVRVKCKDDYTNFKYADPIYDVVSWKGDLFPFTLHCDDMMPLMSHRAHLPPSAHSTFVARDFVVCTFLPRPLEQDADALKVPFYHQNIDYDEVLFYHAGDFFSRDNLHAGMMSFHPAGFAHGPHPKAVKAVDKKTHTNEYAVMVDTRWPLYVDEMASAVEFQDYWKSWKA